MSYWVVLFLRSNFDHSWKLKRKKDSKLRAEIQNLSGKQNLSKAWGRRFQILWPFQKTSTLLNSIFWQLQVIAEDSKNYRLSKETKMLIKNDNECNQHLHIIIGVTLSILVLLALLLLFAILFYLRKSPMEKIQRARSRIYSRLYSR